MQNHVDRMESHSRQLELKIKNYADQSKNIHTPVVYTQHLFNLVILVTVPYLHCAVDVQPFIDMKMQFCLSYFFLYQSVHLQKASLFSVCFCHFLLVMIYDACFPSLFFYTLTLSFSLFVVATVMGLQDFCDSHPNAAVRYRPSYWWIKERKVIDSYIQSYLKQWISKMNGSVSND